MACASTVAVVVPSPAMSLVFDATSRTICAPMFSNLSLSSTSLATVPRPVVSRGAPKLLSMTALRPLGPKVTFTASARMSTPRIMRSRASRLNFTSLAAIWLPFQSVCAWLVWRSADDPEDVAFLHDDEVLTVNLDLGARPFAEQDLVARLDVRRSDLAVVGACAAADGNDFALLRLFLRRIGNDDPAGGLCLGLDPADENAVMKWPETHGFNPLFRCNV